MNKVKVYTLISYHKSKGKSKCFPHYFYLIFGKISEKGKKNMVKDRECPPSPFTLPLFLLAGLLNGFLGTGGGMVLLLGLSLIHPENEKEMMKIATLCSLLFSILTIILYTMTDRFTPGDNLLLLLPAALGGLLGAFLYRRLPLRYLKLGLALLLLLSGLRLLF